jgi:hypothetical protein
MRTPAVALGLLSLGLLTGCTRLHGSMLLGVPAWTPDGETPTGYGYVVGEGWACERLPQTRLGECDRCINVSGKVQDLTLSTITADGYGTVRRYAFRPGSEVHICQQPVLHHVSRRQLQRCAVSLTVTACNSNGLGRQSRRVRDHIDCIYRHRQDRIRCN